MKYKEFKEKVEAWGRKYNYETEVEIKCNYVYVKTKFAMLFKRVARIRADLTWAIDTDWNSFTDIKEDARVELLSIILQLAKTPIEERKDEKRFIIPLHGLITTDGKQQYLSQDYDFFASRRNKNLKQTWKEEHLKYVPEIYRQFAVEFDDAWEREVLEDK